MLVNISVQLDLWLSLYSTEPGNGEKSIRLSTRSHAPGRAGTEIEPGVSQDKRQSKREEAMLAGQEFRWLVDQDLPQIEAEHPDALPITNYGRDIMTEAIKANRWVVTGNRHIMESRTIPFDCPPIVIITGGLCTEEGLRRNLLHFEFCLMHDRGSQRPERQRFLIELDRAIYRLRPEGGLEELETWKVPSVKAVLAWGASA